MTDGEPRVIHVIPRCLQKNFVDENGHIRAYDIHEKEYQYESCEGRRHIDISLSKSAAVIDYWKNKGLDSGKMEEYLNHFETPFSRVIQSILDGQSEINESDQKIIVDWVLSRKVFDSITIAGIKHRLSEYRDSLCLDNTSYSIVEQFISETGDYFTAGYDTIMRVVSEPTVRNIYRKSIWQIIRTTVPSFITSDKCMAEVHNASDTWDCVIPISPHVAIFMSDIIFPFDLKYLSYQGNVSVINKELRSSAQHFWIHNKNYGKEFYDDEKFVQDFQLSITNSINSGFNHKSMIELCIIKLEGYKLLHPDELDIEKLLHSLKEYATNRK